MSEFEKQGLTIILIAVILAVMFLIIWLLGCLKYAQ